MTATALTYRIGVDVGGTFTDVVAIRADGAVVLEKTPTTPPDQSDGVLEGIGRIAAAEGSTRPRRSWPGRPRSCTAPRPATTR